MHIDYEHEKESKLAKESKDLLKPLFLQSTDKNYHASYKKEI